MKILRTASLGSNFTGSYIKKSVFNWSFTNAKTDTNKINILI